MNKMDNLQTVVRHLPNLTLEEFISANEGLESCGWPGETFCHCYDFGNYVYIASAACAVDCLQRQNVPVTLTEVMDYIKSCFTDHCIRLSDAVCAWSRYLIMATGPLKYDLTQKNVRYPDSLKKALDIAEYTYAKLEAEQRARTSWFVTQQRAGRLCSARFSAAWRRENAYKGGFYE